MPREQSPPPLHDIVEPAAAEPTRVRVEITSRAVDPRARSRVRTVDLGELSVQVELADGARIRQRFQRAGVRDETFRVSPDETGGGGEFETADSADLIAVGEQLQTPIPSQGIRLAVPDDDATLDDEDPPPPRTVSEHPTRDVTPLAQAAGTSPLRAPTTPSTGTSIVDGDTPPNDHTEADTPPPRDMAYRSWVESDSASWSEADQRPLDQRAPTDKDNHYAGPVEGSVSTQLVEFDAPSTAATAPIGDGDIILHGTQAGYVLLGKLSATTNSETHLAYAVKNEQTPVPCTLRRLLLRPGPSWEIRRLRFLAEARISAALKHPNLLQVMDWGQHLGSPFVVREIIDGVNLRGMLAVLNRRVELSLVLEIGQQIAAALVYVHGQTEASGQPLGLFNGALALSSIVVSRPATVKLAESSLTRIDARRLRAGKGARCGLAGYAAPEQLRGERVDARTDLFSLGVVLTELLSGQPLIRTNQRPLEDVAHEIQLRCAARKDVPPALTRLILKMTALAPENRTQDAAEVLAGLERVRAQVPSTRSPEAMLAPVFAHASTAPAAPPSPRVQPAPTPGNDTVSAPPPPGPRVATPTTGQLVGTYVPPGSAVVPDTLSSVAPDARLLNGPPRAPRSSRAPAMRVRTTGEVAPPPPRPAPDLSDPALLSWLDERYVTRSQWNATLGIIFGLTAVLIVLGGMLLER